MTLFKNILRFLLMVGLMVYLGYTFLTFSKRGSDDLCASVNISVTDSATAGFVTVKGIEEKLHISNQYPVGQNMDSISCQKIKDVLLQDHFIADVTCYKTPARQVHIIVSQRVPVLRVMADNGENYYLDEKGFRMNPDGYYADLAVVTGNVDYQYVKEKLLPFGLIIRQDGFWNDQIEQIYVTPERELQLTTRIGDLVINAGTADNLDKKLHNLYVFYKKVMSEVGWNQYSEISIAYTNQVVCKKKKK